MWFETVNIKIRHLIYLLPPVTVLRIMPACFNTPGAKPVSLHWELTLHQNKAATQPLGQKSFLWSQRTGRATGGGGGGGGDAPTSPVETSLLLFVPPLPPCAWNTSAKFMCFPEPGETPVHLATSSLEVTWGQLHGMELPRATLHSPARLSISDFLSGLLLCQHCESISKTCVNSSPTVPWHGKVGKQLHKSSLTHQVYHSILKITYSNTEIEGTENKMTQTKLLECPQATSLLD